MNQACLLCGSPNARTVDQVDYSALKGRYQSILGISVDVCLDSPFEGKEILLLECGSCGLQYFSPTLTGNEGLYKALARNSWYYDDAKWEFQVAVEKLQKMGPVLEVGCGSGKFLSRLAAGSSSKKNLVGLELSSKAAADARALGFLIHEMSVEAFAKDTANQGCFDAVCAFQVLEHAANPKTFLESSLKCLKPGGLLLVSVPNREGVFRDTVNYILDMPPHHVTRWSTETMKNVSKLFHLNESFVALEPVAEYHKAWCRQVVLRKRIGKWMGIRSRMVEPERSAGQLVLKVLTRLTEKLIPKSAWNYDDYQGHTFCVGFTNSGER